MDHVPMRGPFRLKGKGTGLLDKLAGCYLKVILQPAGILRPKRPSLITCRRSFNSLVRLRPTGHASQGC
jgi:hypothetical protein